MQDFRNLLVWQKSHRLVLELQAVLALLGARREFELRSQMLRSARSIPANIAEGCGRGSDRDFRRFLVVALGSASELEYHLLLARDLGLLPKPEYQRLSEMAAEIKRMLSGLTARLSTSIKRKLKADC